MFFFYSCFFLFIANIVNLKLRLYIVVEALFSSVLMLSVYIYMYPHKKIKMHDIQPCLINRSKGLLHAAIKASS